MAAAAAVGVGGGGLIFVRMHEKKGNVTARLDARCHTLSYTYWCIAN